MRNRSRKRASRHANRVAQTSKSAVSQVSKLRALWHFGALPIWKSAIQQVWKPALRRFVALQLVVKPRARESPVTLRRPLGNVQHLGGFIVFEANKETETDKLG